MTKSSRKSFHIAQTWGQPSLKVNSVGLSGSFDLQRRKSDLGERSSWTSKRSIKSTWGTVHHPLPTRPPAENCVILNLVTQSVIHNPKGRAVKIFILIWLPIKWSWETLLRSVPVNVLLRVRRSNYFPFRWFFASARAVTYRVTWTKVQNIFSV